MVGARTPDEVKERYDVLVEDVNSIECDQVLARGSTPDMAKESRLGKPEKGNRTCHHGRVGILPLQCISLFAIVD